MNSTYEIVSASVRLGNLQRKDFNLAISFLKHAGGRYDEKSKTWTIPGAALPKLRDLLASFPVKTDDYTFQRWSSSRRVANARR